MANIGEVLSALGGVVGHVDQAARAVGEAHGQFRDAHSTLAVVLTGHQNPDAADALAGMQMATSHADEVVELLSSITGKLADFVERLPQGGRNIRPAGCAGRAVPDSRANTPREHASAPSRPT